MSSIPAFNSLALGENPAHRVSAVQKGALAAFALGLLVLALVSGGPEQPMSMIGYASQEVAVEGRSVVNASLAPSAVSLEGLVVVGYTTQTRRDISGAVAAGDDEALETRKVATLEEALKGRVAGVNIKTSGEPGQGAAITVRGQNFLYNASPLYVVDGLYMTQNPNLNPNDVASIQILKDASAASQYGAQAANGVVVITTRRGQAADRRLLGVLLPLIAGGQTLALPHPLIAGAVAVVGVLFGLRFGNAVRTPVVLALVGFVLLGLFMRWL